ncbi:MAG: glycosyltransferase [Acidobacteriota bacterium]|jgi:glycosyltransferase involved in cell wall biosynthesis
MRITYLLEGTELFGGTKVALRQANLLTERGHRVRVLAKGPRPSWLSIEAEFRQVESFETLRSSPEEVCVATYWTTIRPAAASGGVAVHYCQGYEGDYTHNVRDHRAIEDAYRTPLPAMTVAPHLAELLRRRFAREACTVAQPLEPSFRPARLRLRPRRPPRILVTGPFEIDWKGVETALRAVEILRQDGLSCELVRLSQWPAPEAERALLAADELHVGLSPERVAALVRGCDLLLAPSWEQEGFGLPVLEAMASGVPVVASDIAPFRWFAHPAAALAPVRDPRSFAARAREILTVPRAWRHHRRRGLDRARRFTEERAGREAEEALRRALGGRAS